MAHPKQSRQMAFVVLKAENVSAGVEVDIRHRLGDFRLEVSAKFGPGISGLIGPSGAGKSTLLACIAGLTKPDEGRVVINGIAAFDGAAGVHMGTDRRGAVLVHQHGNLFPHMTVRGNVEYGHRHGAGDVKVDELVDALGIARLMDRQPDSLSGGQRQRVAVARAVAAGPAVLLLDEPVASLDAKSRNEVVMYLHEVHERYNIPMVYVSHALSDVLALADETLTMSDGKAVGFGDSRGQVLAMAQAIGTESVHIDNVLFGRVVSDDQVAVGETVLYAPRLNWPAGESVALSVRASEIIVAVGKPSPSSARNVLGGRVVALTESAGVALATVDVGVELTAELTRHSVLDLGLSVGADVHLVFKASSVIVS